jgi:hypothetical protein
MAKYLKIKVQAEKYSDTSEYSFVEVDDDFDPDQSELDNDELWACIDDAVACFVETDYEVLEGNWRDDKDF